MSAAELIDIAACGCLMQDVVADVCIIGAGAAGIYLGTRLAKQGLNVVLLEAGARSCVGADAMGFEAQYDAGHYRGASAGRYFGLGGSTSLWGGQLVPHTVRDHRPESQASSPWRHITSVVSERSSSVLRSLGFHADPDFEDFPSRTIGAVTKVLGVAGLSVQASLMLPFRLKNFSTLLRANHGDSGSLRVYFNSIVNAWDVTAEVAGCRVTSASAASPNGNQLRVSSPRFVIAAGALESARMLLELQAVSGDSAIPQSAATGCYLADHLSVAIADVEQIDEANASTLFAPRFQRAWMRSFRFLESTALSQAPRAFAHFIFSDPGSGFKLAKEILGSIQGRRRPEVTAKDVFLGSIGASKLAYHRIAKSALYVSPASPIHLQLDVEQLPVRENCVRLGETRDRYGRRHAHINWRVSNVDCERIGATARSFLTKWPGPIAGLPRLKARSLTDGQIKPHDAYHPVGTCRMGEDREAVVDLDLRVHGLANLWVASTAVLPSAGSANPTFTMLCLADRMARRFCEAR